MTRAEYNRRSGRSSKWIRSEKREAIYTRDDHRCGYCNRDLRNAPRTERSLDHLVPQIRGGSNHETNLITACKTCNSSRRHRAWRPFARRVGGDAAVRRIVRNTRRVLYAA